MEGNTSDCCPENGLFCYAFIENPNGISVIMVTDYCSTWQLVSGYLGKYAQVRKPKGMIPNS